MNLEVSCKQSLQPLQPERLEQLEQQPLVSQSHRRHQWPICRQQVQSLATLGVQPEIGKASGFTTKSLCPDDHAGGDQTRLPQHLRPLSGGTSDICHPSGASGGISCSHPSGTSGGADMLHLPHGFWRGKGALDTLFSRAIPRRVHPARNGDATPMPRMP